MKIVIDIPEELFNIAKDGMLNEIQSMFICGSVIQGKPLPKEYGDLIDRSEVIKSLFDYHKGQKTIGQCIDDVQTIIEADKAESEEV